MKTMSLKTLMSFFLLLFMPLVSAQTNPQSANDFFEKDGLEISIGLALGGPNRRFAEILEDVGFNERINGLFGPIYYPVTRGKGGAFTLGYNRRLGKGPRLGVELSFADLGETAGSRNGYVEAAFRSYGIGAYCDILSSVWILRAGPQLMFNTVFRSESSGDVLSTSTTAGLKVNLEVRLWNGKSTYGKLGGFYILTYATEHGPFPITSGNSEELEARNLNFGYGALQLTMGIRL